MDTVQKYIEDNWETVKELDYNNPKLKKLAQQLNTTTANIIDTIEIVWYTKFNGKYYEDISISDLNKGLQHFLEQASEFVNFWELSDTVKDTFDYIEFDQDEFITNGDGIITATAFKNFIDNTLPELIADGTFKEDILEEIKLDLGNTFTDIYEGRISQITLIYGEQ